MDFDAVADELYAGPRDDFIPTRNQRVAEAKKAGDKELAQRIGALRKPSLAASLVNQLAHDHPDELRKLIELGDEMRAAHADLDGTKLRELSHRKRTEVEKVTERVCSLGSDPTQAVMDQVSDTLEAAIANPDAAAEVVAGRLEAALAPSGFDQWMIASVDTHRRSEPKKPGKDDEKPADPKQREKQEKIAAARDRLSTAQDEQSKAEDALAKANDAATEAEQQVEDLKAQLAEAERDLRKTRDAAREAQREYDAAVRAVKDAEKALNRLEPS